MHVLSTSAWAHMHVRMHRYEGWEPYSQLPDAERPYSFGWGGGGEWTAAEGAMWAAAADACRYKHPWVAGDVLIIDNMLSMHGREMYAGARRLGVVLAFPIERDPVLLESRKE